MANSNGKRVTSAPARKTTAGKTGARQQAAPKRSVQSSRSTRTGKASAPKKRGGVGFVLVPLCIILLVAAAYGGLCYTASTATTFYPNTRVLGVNLGGMTLAEAQEEISDLVEEAYADQSIQVQVGEASVYLALSQLVVIDSAGAANQAWTDTIQSGITSGFYYLKMLSAGCDVDVADYISFTDQDTLYQTIADTFQGFDGAVVQSEYQITDSQILITKGTSGQAVDLDQLQEQILAALESGDYTTSITCQMLVTQPEALDLDAIYDLVYTEPVSATCDEEANIIDDVQGISFDLTAAQQALSDAEEGSVVTIPLVYTDAEVTAEQLSELLFRDVLGTASSNVSGTSARISNVKLAAASCDGIILNPGESFSYNDVVGERTTARGYQAAPAYSNGETVQEVGGGICQVSSTIYLATLRSNLEIVQRKNHTYLCSYMPYGEDATVSWGGPDFVFKNDTDYPIKIVVTYSSGVLTATVYGTNLTGEYTVITNEVTSTTSYETVYKDTDTLAAGKTSVQTTGYNGMTVKVYRNVYAADGTLISSTLESNNTYKVRNKVVLRGTGTTTTTTNTTTDTTTDTSTTDTTTTDTTTDTTTTTTDSSTATNTDTSTATDTVTTQSTTSETTTSSESSAGTASDDSE